MWSVYDESVREGEYQVGVGNKVDSTALVVWFDNLQMWDILDLQGAEPRGLKLPRLEMKSHR